MKTRNLLEFQLIWTVILMQIWSLDLYGNQRTHRISFRCEPFWWRCGISHFDTETRFRVFLIGLNVFLETISNRNSRFWRWLQHWSMRFGRTFSRMSLSFELYAGHLLQFQFQFTTYNGNKSSCSLSRKWKSQSQLEKSCFIFWFYPMKVSTQQIHLSCTGSRLKHLSRLIIWRWIEMIQSANLCNHFLWKWNSIHSFTRFKTIEIIKKSSIIHFDI